MEAIRTIDDLTRANRATRPQATALIFGDRRMTFETLDRRASQVANRLTQAGVGYGDRIAVLAKNCDTFFELMHGAAKIGAVLVPVNFRLAPREISFIVNDSGAKLLFVDTWFGAIVDGIASALEPVETIIRIAGAGDAAGQDRQDFDTWRDQAAETDPMLPISPEDDLIQMYTSGTTGLPKGVQLTHGNIAALLDLEMITWDDSDVSLVVMPLFHIAGAAWALVAMAGGAPNIIMADVDPGAILRHIGEDRVTKTLMVPAVILFVLQHPDCPATDFSSMKLVTYGASPIPIDLLQQAVTVMGCGFMQLYGLTETTGMVVYLPEADHSSDGNPKMASCGIPVTAAEIRVVGVDGADMPPYAVGEIIVKSPQVMKGYWNQPEATAAAIVDGWFHTGDAGFLDEHGYLYIHDRIKDMIISGGENIYPAEVESALFEHEAVADVGVIGVPDTQWGEAVRAVIVKAPEGNVAPEELIAFARERIAGFKIPRSVVFADAVPRNPAGKILKTELRKLYGDGGSYCYVIVRRSGPPPLIRAFPQRYDPMKTPGPDHPIFVQPLERHVTVTFNGKTVAESRDALEMSESTYKPVYYIPMSDVDQAVLSKTAHGSYCPYKGEASYYTVTVGIESAENAIWTYEAPYEAVAAIKDHVAFYADKMDSISVG